MKRLNWFKVGSLAGMAALLATAGCSGGGSGTTPTGVTALTVAEQVSVVDAQAEEGGGVGKLLGLVSVGDLPALSDFKTDRKNVYVAERSGDVFNTVNEILCMMAQTRYDEMLNKGPYKALINENVCSASRSSASAGSAGSSAAAAAASSAPNYVTWLVKSERASNSSDQIVQVQFREREDDAEQVIEARAVIEEGATPDNPYGVFKMSFLGYIPELNETSANPGFTGVMEAKREDDGRISLNFMNEMGETELESVKLFKDGTGGHGSVKIESDWDNAEFDFAFTENLFRRRSIDGLTDVCLNRKSFENSVWRYGLYDSDTGARITRNSGFPIKYTSGGTEHYGFVGYWGLYTSDNVTVPDGATVTKQAMGNDPEKDYTLKRVAGKLKKHTRNATTLAKITDVAVEGFDQSTMTSVRYEWDGTGFKKLAVMATSGDNMGMWQNLAAEQQTYLDLANVQQSELNFWSQSLGGQVRIPLTGTWGMEGFTATPGQLSNSTAVYFYVEKVIMPGETVPATLACFSNCPQKSGITVTSLPENWTPGTGSQRYNFTFDTANLVLKSGDTSLVDASTTGQVQFMSGPLFAPTDANLAEIECDGFEGDTIPYCGWQAWSKLSEFYTWETGNQQWSQLALLMDGSTVKAFEQPLRVTYDSSQNGDGPFYVLDYNSFGDLGGIPGKCVNMNTGAVVSCEPSREIRYVSEFSIPEGHKVTAKDPNGGADITYYVKPLEMEQRMLSAEGACGALATTHETLPETAAAAGWAAVDLDDDVVASNSEAPAVIGGVVQE